MSPFWRFLPVAQKATLKCIKHYFQQVYMIGITYELYWGLCKYIGIIISTIYLYVPGFFFFKFCNKMESVIPLLWQCYFIDVTICLQSKKRWAMVKNNFT